MNLSFDLQIAKVVAPPADGLWSQVHTFFPEEGEKKEKRGNLLAVLVINGVPEGVEAIAAGREVLGRLHEEYFGDLKGSPFACLKAALEKVGHQNPGLEIVAAVLFDQVLYLAIFGQGRVLLKRGDRLGLVLESNPAEPDEVQTASGLVEDNDLLVIGSNRFFEVVGSGVLKASLESNSPTEAVEIIAPIVLGRKETAAAAALLTLAKKKEPVEISPVTAEEDYPPPEEKKPKRNWPQIKKFFPKQPIFVRRGAADKKKRLYLLVASFFLILLGLSLVFGLRKRSLEVKKAKAGELVRQAEERLNQAKTLVSDRPSEGKVLGEQAQALTQEALSLVEGYGEAAFVKEQTESFLSGLGEEVSLTPGVFMDLNIIADEASGAAFALTKEDLAILDPKNNKVYFLNFQNKSYQTVSYSGQEGEEIVASGGKVYVFDAKGLFEVFKSKEKATAIKGTDSHWPAASVVGSYLGHFYLLDPQAKAIWRYLASDEGMGEAKNWFVGTPPDLSGSVSLAIDGTIWVLEENGIMKLNLGREESFSLKKMPEEFSNPTRIFTDGEAKNLYVLDQGRSKIYVIDKEGNFKAAYFWEGLKEADNIVAVESIKKLFILQNNKIYEIGLK